MTSRNTVYNKRNLHWVCKECKAHYTRSQKECACGSKLWKFDSDSEYDRYKELALLAKSGKIRDFRPKLVFPLVLFDHQTRPVDIFNKRGGYRRAIPTYESDFTYHEEGLVVEDVKSTNPKADDPVFKLKARLFAALYGFEITIVRKSS